METFFVFMELNEIIQKAKDLGSYFITITTRDKTKTENDLNHYVFQHEFDRDNIIPSLDASILSMGIKPEKPVDVIMPEPHKDEGRRLKILIVSHFNRMPFSYSPARAVRNQIKMLKEHGHEVTFLIYEGSSLTNKDLGCTVKPIIPKFKREKNVINEEGKRKIIDVIREELTGSYDCAITHDFFLRDTVTFSEAIRECGVDIPWLHFARSGIGHEMDFSMKNARFVYLNKSDVGHFAKAIKVRPEQCRTVFNEKEPAFMFNWHPITQMIVKKFQLWEKDIIQTYPMCSTRFDAKGLDSVIKVFVELKRLGNKVCLIVPNANGRRRVDDLRRKQEFAKEMGLNEDEFIFTSLLHSNEYNTESEVPNQVCAELMQISNLFIFPTIAEVGPNVLLEASMAKNLVVINEDLPLLKDFCDQNSVLSYPFTSSRNMHYKERDAESLARLARKIQGELRSNKIDKQFRLVWRKHNATTIYHMLMSVIYELIEDFKNGKL